MIYKIKLGDGQRETGRHPFRLKDHRRIFQGEQAKKQTLLRGSREFQAVGTAGAEVVRW